MEINHDFSNVKNKTFIIHFNCFVSVFGTFTMSSWNQACAPGIRGARGQELDLH